MQPVRTYKGLGLLLTYPSEEIAQVWPELLPVFREEGLLSTSNLAQLEVLLTELTAQPLIASQERYVGLFDRTRSVSLHLFEHVHGEGRERGQAMVSLSGAYAQAGWFVSNRELPDYLPAICEFLSVSPEARGALLQDICPILELIRGRLARMGSHFAPVLDALVLLSGAQQMTNEDAVEADGDDAQLSPETLEQLDSNWEEAPVTFGVGDAHDSCEVSSKRQMPIVKLRRSAAGDTVVG